MVAALYTLGEAQDLTGESRHLINFLLRDRQIPVRQIGMAKVLDEAGFQRLVLAIADFKAKTGACVLVV